MIIYAVIARLRDAAVLVESGIESSKSMGNIPQVSTTVLEHLRDQEKAYEQDQSSYRLLEDGQRKTLSQKNEATFDFFNNFIEACQMVASMGDDEGITEDGQEFYFHLFRKDGVIYLCLADDVDLRDQKVSFAFLDMVQGEFVKRFRSGKINTANAYSLNKVFQPNLRSAIHYHNTNHEKLARDEKVQKTLAQVEDLKTVVGRNILLALENKDKYETLVDKSSVLLEDAQLFKKRGKKLKSKMRQNYIWVSVCCCLFVLFILSFPLLIFCGPGLQYCRVGGGNNSNDNNNQAEAGNSNNYNNDDAGNNNGGGRLRW